jgi:hypothetical protein
MYVFEIRNAELIGSITKQTAGQGITYAAIVALIGAVRHKCDGASISSS